VNSFINTHQLLIRWLKTPIEELERKALKATRLKQKIWTQEEIDLGRARGKELALLFQGRKKN
jgi:hypothetical protein